MQRTAAKRCYDDACAAAHAMDIIGDRWALPVLRELMFGPCRFSDLRRNLPALSANVLTQRLSGLEKAGVVERTKLPPPASVNVYALSPWGQEAEPILWGLGRWAAKSPLHDPTRPFSPVSLMLSMKTMFDPDRARRFTARVGFSFGEVEFSCVIDQGKIAIGRGLPERPDLVLGGRTGGVAAFIYGGMSLDEAQRLELLTVEGDQTLAKQLPSLFPLPNKMKRD